MNPGTPLELGDIDKPLLVFGGPYSNLAATEAMLARAAQLGFAPEQIICTGDVVAYCAEPEQTCQLLIESGIHVVMGNCEESLASEADDCGCGFEPGMLCSTLSEKWYRYANQHISPKTRQWMGQLPRSLSFMLAGYRIRVIHGGVKQINRFIFASSENQIKLEELQQAQADIIIAGHCGIPFGQKLGQQAWLNAGVIGLPANDGTNSGWYLTLTPANRELDIEWHRLDYDHDLSFKRMQDAGLHSYAQTLQTGLWPSMDILPAKERAQQGEVLNPGLVKLTIS